MWIFIIIAKTIRNEAEERVKKSNKPFLVVGRTIIEIEIYEYWRNDYPIFKLARKCFLENKERTWYSRQERSDRNVQKTRTSSKYFI